ncbi:unnamed protein product [Penicillium pancosmium]
MSYKQGFRSPQCSPPSASERYKVFTPEFDTVAFDPLDTPKRYHTGIFVGTDPETLRGELFYVTGDIIANSGMRFEVKDNYVPGAEKDWMNLQIRLSETEGYLGSLAQTDQTAGDRLLEQGSSSAE